jgi:hypothetical protein
MQVVRKVKKVRLSTHVVFNQACALENYNPFGCDPVLLVLQFILRRERFLKLITTKFEGVDG